MQDAKLDGWFEQVNKMIQDARAEAGDERKFLSLVEAVQVLAEVVREVYKKTAASG